GTTKNPPRVTRGGTASTILLFLELSANPGRFLKDKEARVLNIFAVGKVETMSPPGKNEIQDACVSGLRKASTPGQVGRCHHRLLPMHGLPRREGHVEGRSP